MKTLFLKVQNVQFFKNVLKMFFSPLVIQMLRKHSMLSFFKHYEDVTFECFLNILKQEMTFKKHSLKRFRYIQAQEDAKRKVHPLLCEKFSVLHSKRAARKTRLRQFCFVSSCA